MHQTTSKASTIGSANMQQTKPHQTTTAIIEKDLANALDNIEVRGVHIWFLVLVCFGAVIDALTQNNIGVIGPTLAKVWQISSVQLGYLSSITFFGMAVGSVLAGITNDKYGRKATYSYNLLIFTLGSIVAGTAGNFGILLIARFICGVGLGGELSTALTLVAETMPTRFRGAALGAVNVAAGGAGLFLAPAIGAVMLGPLESILGGPDVAWRWVLGIMAIPAVVVFLYRLILPESPRYLLTEGRVHEANAVLTKLATNKLRTTASLQVTNYIKVAEGNKIKEESVSFFDIFKGQLLKRTLALWTTVAMSFGAQLTVLIFLPTILVSEGYNIQNSLIFSAVINVGGILGAVLASFWGDRVRRKIVLGYGALVALCAALGFAYSSATYAVLCFGGLLQFMFILLNTTGWMWAPELYPTKIRGFGTGCAVNFGFLSASFFPIIAGWLFALGGAVPIFIMIAMMFAIMAIAVQFGTETKGAKLEDVSGEHVML